jgi:hypothetical protein
MVWHSLAFVGMFWLLAFIAAMLLCAPILFKRLPRRYRLRLPNADEIRASPPVESKPPRVSNWRYLLLPIVGPFMLALVVLVLFSAFAAMGLCALAMNYRYCRRMTYRALKRRHAVLAYCRSYPTGFAVFVKKIVATHC